MKTKIKREEVFQIPSSMFTIGPSSSGYTLNVAVSAAGPYTPYYKTSPANTVEPVVNANPAQFYKLVGNTDEVDILY